MRMPKRQLQFSSPSRSTSRVAGTYSAKKQRTVSTALASVAASVRTLKRKASVDTTTVYYQQSNGFSATSVLGNAANYQNLCKYSGWKRVFGTDADDETGKMARIKSLKLDWTIKTTTEQNCVDAMICVFRLKDEASADINTSGDFNSTTWPVIDSDMAYAPVGTNNAGIAGGFLNPNKYQVLYAKRYILNPSNNPQSHLATNIVAGLLPVNNGGPAVPNVARGNKTFTFGKGGILLKSPAGDWRTTVRPLSAKNNVFFAVFTNDSSVDGSNTECYFTSVMKVEV